MKKSKDLSNCLQGYCDEGGNCSLCGFDANEHERRIKSCILAVCDDGLKRLVFKHDEGKNEK